MSRHSHRSTNLSRMFTDTSELSDQELVKQVNQLKQEVLVLQTENEIIEKTITRLEPGLLIGLQAAFEYALKLHSSASIGTGSFLKSKTSTFGLIDSIASPSRMLTSTSRASTRRIESCARIGGFLMFGNVTKVNVLERLELVSTELEILIHILERAKIKGATKQALLKAQMEEISVREVDFEKATQAFNQEVIADGWDKIAQRIPAEIWIRNMTEWVKHCDRQIGKLRLRTSTLNTQFHKLKGQIRVKEELSECLRPVDFEKLEIENGICQEVIEQKLTHLVELKKMTGDANLLLTIHKKSMTEQNSYLAFVMRTIKDKETQRVELIKETQEIQTQADYYQRKLDDVKEVRNAYEVPDIMDYVMVKSEVTDLKHSIKVLKNRTHIHEIALGSLNKKLHSMKNASLT